MQKREAYRIVIADDQSIVREGIAAIINSLKDFAVVGQAESGDSMLDLIDETGCDLALCDLVMPGMDGLKVLKALKKKYPGMKVVIITMNADRGLFNEAVGLGADGYALKDDSSETVLALLRGVMEGNRCFSPRIQTMLVRSYGGGQSPAGLLTDREYQVFRLVAGAFSNREIADRLGISLSTVEFHKKNIKDKLNARNTADLLNIAHKYDVI